MERSGEKTSLGKSKKALVKRLNEYLRPDVDPVIEKDLKQFVKKRCNAIC